MLKDRKQAHDPKNPEKMSFVFEGKALADLQKIARHENKTLDEVLEDALGLKQWAVSVKDKGEHVVVRKGLRDRYELGL
ncbi:hypothetical protein BH18ACT10_BH18ACT10_07650 [soil metagenome]|nr:hypothetical protein [Rubrobacter sp.]